MHIPLKAKLEFFLSHLLFGRFVNVDKAIQKESTENYKSSNNKPSYQCRRTLCGLSEVQNIDVITIKIFHQQLIKNPAHLALLSPGDLMVRIRLI